MMIQTDRERLAVSAAISLLFYGGFFAATAWLDILKPAPPREYFGELTVQVTLEKPEPPRIQPPKGEIVQPAVQPKPQPTPPPTPKPAATVKEPAPAPVTRTETVTTPAPRQPSQTQSAAASGTPGASQSASAGGAAAAAIPAPSSPAIAQAGPVQSPQYFGESESVSVRQSEAGSLPFESVREDTTSSQFGESKIVYGTEQLSQARESATPPSARVVDKPAFVDLTALNSVSFPGEAASGTQGGSTASSGPAHAATGNVIEAASFTELMSKRLVEHRYDPDLRGLRLPGGLKTMNVWVEFLIQREGVVLEVKVADTGDSILNARIGEALRRWKFEPIQQDLRQVARLLYIIEATN